MSDALQYCKSATAVIILYLIVKNSIYNNIKHNAVTEALCSFFPGQKREGDKKRERSKNTHFMDCRIQTHGMEYSI